MSTSIASVANNLPSANHLANCEETQDFCTKNGSECELRSVDISNAFDDRFWGGGFGGFLEEGGGVSEGLEDTLKVGLEGGHGRRIHLLALEHELGELQADTRVVNSWWDLSLNKRDESSGPAANLAQRTTQILRGITQVLRSVTDSWPSSRAHSRETLGSFSSVLCSLLGRLGSSILRCLAGFAGCRLKSGSGSSETGQLGGAPEDGAGEGRGHGEDDLCAGLTQGNE